MNRGFGTPAEQERTKKRLNALLRLPENKFCCECNQRQPSWASINLGMVFCIRCAGIHRNLGVNISAVRSATLDSWKPDWVDMIEMVGNSRGNAYWEAKDMAGRKPTEHTSDTTVERFIRDKYIRGLWKSDSLSPPHMGSAPVEQQPQQQVSSNSNTVKKQQPLIATQQRPQITQSQPQTVTVAGPRSVSAAVARPLGAPQQQQQHTHHDPFSSLDSNASQPQQQQQQQTSSSITMDFDSFFSDNNTPSNGTIHTYSHTQHNTTNSTTNALSSTQKSTETTTTTNGFDFFFGTQTTTTTTTSTTTSSVPLSSSSTSTPATAAAAVSNDPFQTLGSSTTSTSTSKSSILSLYDQAPQQQQQYNKHQQPNMYSQPQATQWVFSTQPPPSIQQQQFQGYPQQNNQYGQSIYGQPQQQQQQANAFAQPAYSYASPQQPTQQGNQNDIFAGLF